MGNQLQCCNPVLDNKSISETQIDHSYLQHLRSEYSHQSSTVHRQTQPVADKKPTLPAIDSGRSMNFLFTTHANSDHESVSSCSSQDEDGYSMQSDSDDHDIVIPLLRQRARDVFGLSQSSTMLADDAHTDVFVQVQVVEEEDKHSDAVSYQCITAARAQPTKTRHTYKQRLRGKQRQQDSAVALDKELSECEIKLVQSQHQRQVLMRENAQLRQQVANFCQQFGVDAKNVVDVDMHCGAKPASSTDEICLSTPKNLTAPSISITPASSKSYSGDTVVSAISSDLQFVKSLSAHPDDDDDDDDCACEDLVDVDVCVSLEHCPALRCMLDALKWYRVHGEQYERVYKKMKEHGYGERVMKAYNHVLQNHLNGQDEYAAIASHIMREVGDCAFSNCGGQQRYMRSKQGRLHQAPTKQVNEIQSYTNTMDGIHCCFVHLAKNLK